jgi:chorismate mutase
VADFEAQATELELSINGSKCAILIFGKQKTKETIELDDVTVKISENYRCLRITIDRHLHFGTHVKELHTALQRRLNLLKYIAGVKWGEHPKVMNILYKNFIRSKMDYGATVTHPRHNYRN